MKLTDTIKTKKIEIGIPESEEKVSVTLFTDLPWSDWLEISESKESGKAGITTLLKFIKEWDLEGDDGSALAINEENIVKLPAFIVFAIKKEISLVEEMGLEKKTKSGGE